MMFYLSRLSQHFGPLRVFEYSTFRGIAAAFTAFLLSVLFGKLVIRKLISLKFGQPVRTREEVNQLYETHGRKKGTPTMGGVLIIGSVVVSALLWARPTNPSVWLAIFTIIYLGALGFADDYKKVTQKNSRGVSSRVKLIAQFVLAGIVVAVFLSNQRNAMFSTDLYVPFLKKALFPNMGLYAFGLIAFLFYGFVIVGCSNAVNLTDGLDGLAAGCTVTVAGAYAALTFAASNPLVTRYLDIPFTPGSGELTVLCSALAGAGLGFLWFNAHPAQVFMGDTGSLAIGGFIAIIAICCKQELLLVIVGGVFVMEAGSVIIQVASFKLTGKRVFAMSPLHHHFELIGWKETTVVVRFWIISVIFAIVGLATLKFALTRECKPRAMKNYKGKKVAVLGLGRSGEAAAILLLGLGARVSILDSAEAEKFDAAKLQKLGGMGLHIIAGSSANVSDEAYDLAVLSPGIDPKCALVQNLLLRRIPIIAEIELAYDNSSTPVIGITGTNGKTTTTELVAAMLTGAGTRTVAGGNIGKPYSEIVSEGESLDVITLEVSSFQLERIQKFRPAISVWLNLTPDHLDRYESTEDYRVAKLRIFENQQAEDWAVVNLRDTLPPLAAKRITFSAYEVGADLHLRDEVIHYKNQPLLDPRETHLRGNHNTENLMAALGVGLARGLTADQMGPALRNYRPQPHRCEVVRQLDGVTYINDSKATNLDALAKALASETQPVILIAGGKDKGFEFDTIAQMVGEKARWVVLIGEMAERIATVWKEYVPCERVESLQEAVRVAWSLARSGEVVLFSPGTSSFDMFKSYADRGNQFRALVNALRSNV